MDLSTSVKVCFKKYATFEGRAQRSEFWYFCLFCLLVGIVTLYIDISVLGYSVEEEYTPLNTIAYLAVFIPSISVTARRLHDIGKSGWWMLLALTGIGIILLIIWYATEGEKKKNRFGNPIKIK
jgi:uncharacterized membrane protein YhaH (DUF805 family)|tara:strand:- start:763 stop:1134 length:372 start_codon:yes stop_codon:yes gene_type:complete